MKKGQIVVTVTDPETEQNDVTVQTKTDDFSSAETASYLFMALMATYGIDEEGSKRVFNTMFDAVEKELNK